MRDRRREAVERPLEGDDVAQPDAAGPERRAQRARPRRSSERDVGALLVGAHRAIAASSPSAGRGSSTSTRCPAPLGCARRAAVVGDRRRRAARRRAARRRTAAASDRRATTATRQRAPTPAAAMIADAASRGARRAGPRPSGGAPPAARRVRVEAEVVRERHRLDPARRGARSSRRCRCTAPAAARGPRRRAPRPALAQPPVGGDAAADRQPRARLVAPARARAAARAPRRSRARRRRRGRRRGARSPPPPGRGPRTAAPS